jgi:hypothetical protein
MTPACLALWLTAQEALPEGNAFVRGLVGRQRVNEEALNDYAYDLIEVQEDLDRSGAVSRRRSRRFEVFHVQGRPIRRLVEEDDRPLPAQRRAAEDRRVRELITAVRDRRVAVEQSEVRLSQILERYDFQTVGREDVEGRTTLVLDFRPLPGPRPLEGDRVLRRLEGRIWVDEVDRVVARADVRSTGGVRFALGLAASLSSLGFTVEFRKVDGAVWLPWRVESRAAGRLALVKSLRTRVFAAYGPYRRFQVKHDETIRSPSPEPR